MRIARLTIENFRGIKSADLQFPPQCVLVGDNNTGKSTILEAIDLVLGPDRLSRRPPVNEHDFYCGRYIENTTEGEPELIKITVAVTLTNLSEEQVRRFRDNIEWWTDENKELLDGPPASQTDEDDVQPALRVVFSGYYDIEEDDFVGETYFLSPDNEDGSHTPFRTSDKRKCGFLFLRTLRTGSRALSLERGSLLDIILRMQEKRLQMWEDVLQQLRELPVAENPELGITDTLQQVQAAVQSIVPSDWAHNPQLRVTNLTRETLRRVLTVFMGTGEKFGNGEEYAAPFGHQGTGTINTLVLALLSIIADLKENVIFAMEEPEIAIPPHTQKRVISSVQEKSGQAFFTSHSPYVLEEFDPSQVLVIRRNQGVMSITPATFPPHIRAKNYRAEFRTRFSEALLARRVLLVEGRTEFDAFSAAATRLSELDPVRFCRLEVLGIALFDVEGDSQVDRYGQYFTSLGKQVFSVFDKQSDERSKEIKEAVDYSFESPEDSFELLVLKQTSIGALQRYAVSLVDEGSWPPHLSETTPGENTTESDLKRTLKKYFQWAKASSGAADLFAMCSLDEFPSYVVDTLCEITSIVRPSSALGDSEDPE